jgi:putative peptidoglycan binding protein
MLCGLLSLGVQVSAGTADTPTKKAASSSPAQPTSVKHSKRKHSTGKHSSSQHARAKSAKGKKKRGQQVIESPRAREIQEALIAQHYMEGKPSGMWDAATQDAMKRYQAAQGWQSKTVPDSRALIKLGLGPSKDGLLNPESAMTAGALANDAKAGPKAAGDPTNSALGSANDNKPQ